MTVQNVPSKAQEMALIIQTQKRGSDAEVFAANEDPRDEALGLVASFFSKAKSIETDSRLTEQGKRSDIATAGTAAKSALLGKRIAIEHIIDERIRVVQSQLAADAARTYGKPTPFAVQVLASRLTAFTSAEVQQLYLGADPGRRSLLDALDAELGAMPERGAQAGFPPRWQRLVSAETRKTASEAPHEDADPAKVAELAALKDFLSGFRAVMGTGTRLVDVELARFGITGDKRVTLTDGAGKPIVVPAPAA